MSCGTSIASARSPRAYRSPGSAPGPPLCPGTWKRPGPRKAYPTTASRYGAAGCSLTRSRAPAGRPQQLGADEAVEVPVEHALGVAHLVAGAVILDHRVRVQDVGADLRAEVHVLGLAALAGDLLATAALLLLEQLRPQHAHRRLAVGGLRALVLALHHDPARAVRDPDGRVGLVHVLAAGARRAVRVDLEVVVLDRDVADLVDDRRHLDAREGRLAAVGRVEGRQPDEPVHPRLGVEETVGVLPRGAEGRRLDAGLFPRAGLEQLDREPAALGPPHEHAQHHLGPVLGVGAARAGVDRDERIARVVAAGEQPLLLERLQALLDRGELLLDLDRELGVLLGQLDEALGVVDVALQGAERLELARRARVVGARAGGDLLV